MSDPTPASADSTSGQPNDDDLRAMLAKRARARPNRTTWVLLALIAVAIGFVLGACTQRVMGSLSESVDAPQPPASSTDAERPSPGGPPAGS